MTEVKTANPQQEYIRETLNGRNEIEKVNAAFPHLSQQQVIMAIRTAGLLREDLYTYIRKHHG